MDRQVVVLTGFTSGIGLASAQRRGEPGAGRDPVGWNSNWMMPIKKQRQSRI